MIELGVIKNIIEIFVAEIKFKKNIFGSEEKAYRGGGWCVGGGFGFF